MIHLVLLWQFNTGWMVKYISLWNDMVGAASWGKCGYVFYKNLTLAFKFCPFEIMNVVKPWDRGFVFVGERHVYLVDAVQRRVIAINVTAKDAVYDGRHLYLCKGVLFNDTQRLPIKCNWLVLRGDKLYVFTEDGIALVKGNKVIKFERTPSSPREGDVCKSLAAYNDGQHVFLVNLTSGAADLIMNVTGVGEVSFSPNCKYLGFTNPYAGQLFIYSIKEKKVVAKKSFIFGLSKCPLYLPSVALGKGIVYVGGGDGWVQAFALSEVQR